MRDPKQEYEKAEAAARQARQVEQQRAVDLADEVFKTKSGRELLEHLCKKYHLHGRAFLNGGDGPRSATCPFAAASRDGERAPLWYLIELARAADPQFFIP